MTSNSTGAVTVHTAPVPSRRASRWPARLDVAQSLTGLVLGLFVGFHLFLDSSILLGPEAVDFIARLFEGKGILDEPQPWIVTVFSLGILTLLVAHAALAMRKLPHDYHQLAIFRHHNATLRHTDTRLWWVQALTGFALFFLVAVHLFMPITVPEDIGGLPSARRVVEDNAWALYIVLLPIVVAHAALGLYRLAQKWGWPSFTIGAEGRRRLLLATLGVAAFYLVIDLAALVAYLRIGLSLGGQP